MYIYWFSSESGYRRRRQRQLNIVKCSLMSITDNLYHMCMHIRTHACTHTHVKLRPSGLCPGLPGWAGTRTNLDFTEARDSEWQWHQLGHMQICTSPRQIITQTDNHASTSPLSFFTGRMSFLPPNQQHQSTEGTVYHMCAQSDYFQIQDLAQFSPTLSFLRDVCILYTAMAAQNRALSHNVQPHGTHRLKICTLWQTHMISENN